MLTRVLIVDDETMTLRNLVAIVEDEASLEVVATAQNGVDALQQTRDTRPDVVVMDLYLPGEFDGVEAIRRIHTLLNPPRVIATTSFDLESYTRGALEAGAVGFILKNDAETYLTRAIQAAAEGDPIVSPQTTSRLIKSFLKPTTAPEIAQARERIGSLTPRELQVAHMIGHGKSYKQIATELHIAADTVKSTVTRALQKSGADNGAQLAFFVGQARLDIEGAV
ncbi:MAG: response regulator transcription factor [Yaniella sp.]|uniref:response regulator transcription factor n=1 Tax=Yaniella sp. TaxID=2773929 RepID=UPI0026496E6A|nr:response regulator transcription factor [Yaniella sp.]MDN6149881.1 response regulator transcription factor [Yaniella sp.]MDN6172508.1 response regulator transcription factor [Yaniella sp.]MDN6678966.1 response regulator transcription factor [Yaniella sp.]